MSYLEIQSLQGDDFQLVELENLDKVVAENESLLLHVLFLSQAQDAMQTRADQGQQQGERSEYIAGD